MAKEYTRDASEYGQQLIADAIRSLGSSNGGSGDGGSVSSITGSPINIVQSDNQTISATVAPMVLTAYYDNNEYHQTSMGDTGVQEPFVACPILCISVNIVANEGYTAGEVVIQGEYFEIQGVDPNSPISYGVPFGSSITLSATPATPV